MFSSKLSKPVTKSLVGGGAMFLHLEQCPRAPINCAESERRLAKNFREPSPNEEGCTLEFFGAGGKLGSGRKLLKGLVGAWGFEPQTPTVSSTALPFKILIIIAVSSVFASKPTNYPTNRSIVRAFLSNPPWQYSRFA